MNIGTKKAIVEADMIEEKDADLINRYFKGDAKALEFLISRYLNQVYGFAFYLTKNSADADDITQETFVKIWKNLKKYDPAKNFKTWALTIAKNTALDFFKKKKMLNFSDFINDGDSSSLEAIPDPEPLPDELLFKKNLAQELNKIIEQLPKAAELIIKLHHQQELTFQEIAEITEQPLNTVKSRYRRALIKLRSLLIK